MPDGDSRVVSTQTSPLIEDANSEEKEDSGSPFTLGSAKENLNKPPPNKESSHPPTQHLEDVSIESTAGTVPKPDMISMPEGGQSLKFSDQKCKLDNCPSTALLQKVSQFGTTFHLPTQIWDLLLDLAPPPSSAMNLVTPDLALSLGLPPGLPLICLHHCLS
ncbi:hypothetical protein Baya_6315 [Bagarius yarrelli]|uniref:Uncharacterized protein n=1 Tax=Bagarius yarrelli TaxID=175774 RepID=A0A556TXX9_BAGYA|nr:hypothetical protein Baya_6315 [Bagarius yarrelli]